MKKLFILGSCVTRDAFSLDEGKEYTIVNYLARTSFASAFHHKATTGINLSSINSPFQRRIVENDLLKYTAKALSTSQFDYLVIDLIDERSNLFVSDNNEIFTLSPELVNNCKYIKQGKIILPNSHDYFELWKKGWENFIALAEKYDFLHKIILNKVFWTNQTTLGHKVVGEEYQSWIKENNTWLEKLYHYIEENTLGIKVVNYPANLLLADDNHKWGVQPFHYDKPVYLHLLSYLSSIKKYQDDFEKNIIHVDYLPISYDNFVIKRIKDKKEYLPVIFCGNEEHDHIIDIHITFASHKEVGEKDLLHTIKYDGEDNTLYTEQKYSLSNLDSIGHFKYISTQPYSVYSRTISFKLPKKTKASFTIQEFYAKGKTIVFDMKIVKR